MAKQLVFLVVLMCLLCCCTAALATDWYVATNGNDSNAGTIGAPFATLNGAIFYHAQAGDTVWVRAGTYTTFMNINGGDACGTQLPDYALLGGAPGAPITIRPYDGDFSAIFTNAVRIVRCKYLTLMGFEMYQPSGGHPLSITSGCTGTDYYSPEHRSNHIVISNCKIHDGGTSSGQCKLQQGDYVTVQDCEFWNLGAGGAVLDCVYVNHCQYLRNYLHDNYSSGGFVKGGSSYNTFDGNVYVNPSTAVNWGFLPGGQTDPPFCAPDVPYESMYTVIRNSIVKGAQRGAMPSNEGGYCYAYNNLWYDCASANGGFSYVTCIPTGTTRHDGYARHFYVFNNIFYDPQGDMRAYGWSAGGGGYWEDWQTGNNCYWNNGQSITVDPQFIDPYSESGRQMGDPHLTLSGSPSTRQAWINYFRPLWDSQSNAMLKDKGNSNAGTIPYPGVIKDIEGNPRPRDGGWDIGPYEYQGTVVTPSADFTAESTWVVPPASTYFTDCSSGGPTAWSWNFGDSTTSTLQNPTHAYTSYGLKTVSLTAYNSAGNNTKSKTSYINVKPLNAAFSASPTWGTAPVAVTFTDASTNSPTAWSWSFGDSNTSTAQNPSHTYNNPGYYTVVLTATNANGNDTCTKSDYITACTEVFVYPNSYDSDPNTPLSSGNLTSVQSDDSNYMVFAAGASGTRTQVNFGCNSGYTRSQVHAIAYEVKMHSSVAGALSEQLAAENITCLTLGLWEWDISAGGSAVGTSDVWLNRPTTNMLAFMNSSGQMGLGLCGCKTSGTAMNLSFNVVRFHLYLKPTGGAAPVANFSGTPTIGTPTLAVSFTDSSTNTPTAWSWTFGDSTSSTAQNPSHSYTAVGNYTVALTATNSYGSDGETKTNYITVGNKPVANFSGTPTIGAPTLAVSFTDSSTYSPTAWAWTFGDSNSSTAQNPSHSYTAVGNYTVALTATNAYGNNTNTKNNYITVGNKPVANFSGTPLSGNAPLNVSFTDSSTYSPTAWSWTFGDSNSSTAQNPSHTYGAGTYTVALTATNAYGNNTNTKNNYVSVSGGSAPVANFTANTTLGLASLAVSFTDTSTNTPTAWSWNFGDSTTSTAQNPSHTYTSTGYYTVSLTATNAYGSDGETKTDYITVCNEVTTYPSSYEIMTWEGGTLASGSLADVQSSNDAYMVFDSNTSTQNVSVRYKWTPSYTPSQTKKLIYDIEWHGSRSDTPKYDVSTHKAPDDYPTLMDFALWPTTDQTFNWTNSTDPGNYIVNGEIWMDMCGCHQNTNNHQTSIDLQRIKLWVVPSGSAPVANFSGTPTLGAAPLAVSFTDSSTNTPTAWSWTFGDSNTSTAQNPSHTYAAGTCTVTLTATNAYGSDGETKTNYITAGNAPVANFSGTPTSGAAPLAVSFTDSSTGSPTAWSWNFGDSTTSTAHNPSHTYSNSGAYTVTLRATNAYGYDDEVKTNYVTAGNAPVANFSGTPTSGAAPLAVSFTDSSTGSPTAWSWNFGDSTTSTAHNPSHTYSSAGSYTVTLRATNTYGYDDEVKTNYITAGNPPVANFTADTTLGLAPLAVSFTDSSTNTPTAWSWSFGDSTTSTAQNPSHTYSSSGYYTVSLTATNAYGSDGETKTDYIAACTEVTIYPSSYEILTFGGGTLASGSLNDLQSSNDSYMTFNSDASSYNVSLRYKWTTSYTPAQTKKVIYDIEWHGTQATTTPMYELSSHKSDDSYPDIWSPQQQLWYTTDHTYNWTNSTDPGDYLVNGEIWMDMCGCHQNTTSYQTAIDLTRIKLWVVAGVSPPVANFSGTPTSGTAPLAVSFTDSSTNTPTAWSWSFGDSSTSTAQNPSHTYAAGTYTVSLTATNAGGSDGETKTNYITVNAAAPTYVAAGAVSSGTGAITPALPGSLQTNDILLLFLETANEGISITNQNGGTWTQVSNSPQSVGTAGGSNGTRLTVFWSRYNGSQGAPTTSDSGNHQLGRIIAIRGATTSGDPCNVTAGNTEATVDTSGAIAGATTTVANTLVVAAIATSLPDASGTANFSAWTNADLTSLAERTDNTVTAGNGGGLAIATGVKATAGAYTTTAVTCGTATTKAMMSIAVKP